MKIKEWIATGIIVCLAIASPSLGNTNSDSTQDVFTSLEEALVKAEVLVGTLQENTSTRWPELQTLQAHLWKAMALDPTFPILVPPAEVPKSLFANHLNQEISNALEEVKKTAMLRGFDTLSEYRSYLATVEQIMKHRQAREFPQARAIAKRGTLDAQFQLLEQKLGQPEAVKPEIEKSLQGVQQQIQTSKELWIESLRDVEKKNIFGGNSIFLWVVLALFFGFFFGIAAYRISPDFFQRFLDQTEVLQPASSLPKTPPAPHSLHLNYVDWLRELEEQLVRFKNSQVNQEKRVVEVVHASEKITQQAISLHSDARIKAEANLEMRMSNLLKDTQYQFEQSQRLAQGDRVQIKALLDHCLILCDAIESNGVFVDRQQLKKSA